MGRRGSSAVGSDGDGGVLTRARVRRLLKFTLVGASGLLCNLAVFAAVASSLWYVLAGVVSWLVANFATYNLNRRFTFPDPRHGYVRGYLRYLAVYLGGFVVYTGVLWALGVRVGQYLALVIAVAVAGLVNFVGSEFWAFDVEV